MYFFLCYSARMAYMSKYLPHLVSKESSSAPQSGSWNSKSCSSGGVLTTASAPQLPSATNSGHSHHHPNMSSACTESSPIPPERPPKKPHLRHLSQQVWKMTAIMYWNYWDEMSRAPERVSIENTDWLWMPLRIKGEWMCPCSHFASLKWLFIFT